MSWRVVAFLGYVAFAILAVVVAWLIERRRRIRRERTLSCAEVLRRRVLGMSDAEFEAMLRRMRERR